VPVASLGDLQLDPSGAIGPGSSAADVAAWMPGDPPTDLDGTMRPTTEGAPDYAGADRPD